MAVAEYPDIKLRLVLSVVVVELVLLVNVLPRLFPRSCTDLRWRSVLDSLRSTSTLSLIGEGPGLWYGVSLVGTGGGVLLPPINSSSFFFLLASI